MCIWLIFFGSFPDLFCFVCKIFTRTTSFTSNSPKSLHMHFLSWSKHLHRNKINIWKQLLRYNWTNWDGKSGHLRDSEVFMCLLCSVFSFICSLGLSPPVSVCFSIKSVLPVLVYPFTSTLLTFNCLTAFTWASLTFPPCALMVLSFSLPLILHFRFFPYLSFKNSLSTYI